MRDHALTIATWNMLVGDDAGPRRNRWPRRRPAAGRWLGHDPADLLAIQEASADQLAWLRAQLPEHDAVAAAREDGRDGGRGEHCPLFFRRERFQLRRSGHFWLSPTPSRPSSNWDGRLPRICSWVRLRDRRSEREFCCFNTHFPHQTRSRQRSAELMVAQIASIAGEGPALLAGDFNSRPSSLVWRSFAIGGLQHGERRFGRRQATRTLLLHGLPIACIDAVFCSAHWQVDDYQVARPAGRPRPSDHRPVLARVRLRAIDQ